MEDSKTILLELPGRKISMFVCGEFQQNRQCSNFAYQAAVATRTLRRGIVGRVKGVLESFLGPLPT